jgi:flagellar motor switch protein FliM
MNPGSESPDPSPAHDHTDVEQLLAKVAKEEAAHAARQAAPPPQVAGSDAVQPYDFRNPMLLSPRELRKLRLHQDEFIKSLASRLSLHLRLEFSLKLTGLQTIVYSKLVESWANPSHLTLFKMEPLRGVSILEIQPQLGFSMVDRLMGGSGLAQETVAEMSEIERALLEQTVQLVLEEWCSHWTRAKQLKPVILGYENNGRFIQTASPETTMLVLSLDAKLGECAGQIQIGFPYATVEPLIRQLSQGAETAATPAPQSAAAPAACKWNASFDDVTIPVIAEWQGLEMTAREILALKIGDVLPMNSACAQQVSVRLESIPKFNGRPGTIAGQWAVELTQVIMP